MKYSAPGFSFGTSSILLYILNHLQKTIKYCKVCHFADGTNLLIQNSSPKQLQEQLNLDLNSWLKANMIALNVSKTELLIFRHPNKKIILYLKLKLIAKTCKF